MFISGPDSTNSAYSSHDNATRVERLSGEQVRRYMKDIGELCLMNFKEWPYLYEGTQQEMDQYIERRYMKPSSVVYLAFKNQIPIGISMGEPLNEAPEHYLSPFSNAPFNLAEIFYWGELVVLPAYRHQDVAKELYSKMGDQILQSRQFKAIAFCTVERPLDFRLNHLKPVNYKSTDALWEKLGFVKIEQYRFTGRWKLINEPQASDHPMIYWWQWLDTQ